MGLVLPFDIIMGLVLPFNIIMGLAPQLVVDEPKAGAPTVATITVPREAAAQGSVGLQVSTASQSFKMGGRQSRQSGCGGQGRQGAAQGATNGIACTQGSTHAERQRVQIQLSIKKKMMAPTAVTKAYQEIRRLSTRPKVFLVDLGSVV